MGLPSLAVDKRAFTLFVTFLLLCGGLFSFTQLGQLEDPEFSVKTAAIATTYPGATAEEVELEVTDRIELAIQEMPQVKNVYSFSRPGFSLIKIDITPSYTADQLPQIWDELRKKVRDMRDTLPPGAGKPDISDDFGDVYGFLMAVVSDGYTYAELEKYVDGIKKELSLVDGVSRAELWGTQTECIYVDVKEAQLSTMGLNVADVYSTLSHQNAIVDAGGVDLQSERLRIQITGDFTSPNEISDLIIRGRDDTDAHGARELILMRDVATVHRGRIEPTSSEMRFNGKMSIGIYISNSSGVNIVDLGASLDKRLKEISKNLPIGIDVHRISWQSDIVSASIVNFMINLAEAVVIVLAVLWIAIGFRSALVVGLCGLIFTIIASFVFMKVLDIDLQRMSLGALIISMGMMVDNAIVVADGVIVRMQRGMDRTKAAIEAAAQPAIPLLGATIIAVVTFYPIAASNEAAGEYCASLFYVVAIALMLSWVLAVTITPLMSIGLIKVPKDSGDGDEYGGAMYRVFASMLRVSLRFRGMVVIAFVALLVVSGIAFKWVDQMFFPESARSQFMIDYWAPEGTKIQEVSEGIKQLEQKLLTDDRVTAVSTFVGKGSPRFYLPVNPEDPYSSYAQLVVNTHTYKDVKAILPPLQKWADENIVQANVITRKYGIGPYESWPVQARFSGPAIADPLVLRDLAEKASDIMRRSPHAAIVRTDWRNSVKKIVTEYDQVNARWTSITREDVGNASRRAYDGLAVGVYREKDKFLPIMLRHVEEERSEFIDHIGELQVRSFAAAQSLPLSQVTKTIGIEWEDPMIWRWDRRRAITVQGVPSTLTTKFRNDVLEEIEAIELPTGYTLEWDGEFSSSRDAQQSLIPGMVPMAVIILLIIVGLFNGFRQPFIIILIIPFMLIGITVGLLLTGQPFGFVALLGAMSLAGMMIKNAIVLLDQVDIELKDGKDSYNAIIDAAMSRLRPVLLAAGTTILGVMPLLQDVFWISMAVTIMFGLAFGTILTMLLVPVLYSIFFKVPLPKETKK